MKINFTKSVRNKLKKIGFETKLNGINHIHDQIKLELPCSLDDADLSQFPLAIGAYSYAARGLRLNSSVKIGRFCSIGEDVKIGLSKHPVDRFSTSPYFYIKNWRDNWNKNIKIKPFICDSEVIIGDDVWIGSNVCILNGVKIGNGAIIGAGSIVTKDVKEFEIVANIPAVKIGERKIQQKFAQEYKSWGVIVGEDFLQFQSLRKKIKRFFTKI